MNILFVSDVSISKVIGGAERVLYEQSTRLAERGHNVQVLTRMTSNHSDFNEIIHAVHEWRYPVDQGSALSFFFSSTRNCRMLFESIVQHTPFDILNFHQPFSSIGILKSPASRTTRKIYTCHSLSFEEYRSRNPEPRGLIQKIRYGLNVQGRQCIEGKVLRSSDRIIVLSTYTRNKLLNQYGISSDNTVLIPGGVDLERFRPSGNRMDVRRRLGIPENGMILLTVRNLVPRMGLENLINAMRDIVNVLPDTLLIIGGSGPLRDALLRLSQDLKIEDHIKFAGFIPDEDLPDYYRAADLFILPTLEMEGFGLVTLEALACGTPVLGTPVGGTLEILQRLDAGYLFDSTGPEAMAKRIVEFGRQYLESPALLREASSRCRTFVEENYSWERNVDLIEALFKTLS